MLFTMVVIIFPAIKILDRNVSSKFQFFYKDIADRINVPV
jgi:hypothetical protein